MKDEGISKYAANRLMGIVFLISAITSVLLSVAIGAAVWLLIKPFELMSVIFREGKNGE